MPQSAMSSFSGLKWEQLSDSESDEWLLFPDEFIKGKDNSPPSNLTTCEIANQTLRDLEDLGRTDDDYWLDEFRLFEEIQSLTPSEDFPPSDHFPEDLDVELHQRQTSPNDGSIVAEFQGHPPNNNQELFPIAYENATTFILSGENVLYLDASTAGEKSKLEEETTTLNSTCQPSPVSEENDMMMEMIEEVLRSKGREWETTGCETSCDSGSVRKVSWEEEEEEGTDGTDDPEWSPASSAGRKHRSRRGGGSLEDKRLRKKEQNKNAATRYRQKKKAEVHSILREEEALKEKKCKLEEKVVDIQNEIRYLKGLMRELFKAKGIIN